MLSRVSRIKTAMPCLYLMPNNDMGLSRIVAANRRNTNNLTFNPLVLLASGATTRVESWMISFVSGVTLAVMMTSFS